ncbi:ATP-binding cassette domain-containing protein [Candidatus Leptofilum sp.]|uniref:ABC transporter ATP-binding protein n=1 Tax=Candidatus Leptofilum sp. TaxID=3241576 RepID=UPI003B5CF766
MIRVANLSFTYAGSQKTAVRNLNFRVAKGEIFGFLGPSGAGKSTTQKILNGLLRGFAGEVTVLERPLTSWGSDYYEQIGVSFELPNHYLKLTATENLTYYAALYEAETRSPEELLALVGLENDGDLLVGQYSKGMKNRLSVARALLHSPQLLFLDEPTAGLDPVNARRIKELIRQQQAAGTTIFLTTHDMNVAGELCDRVAFIVEGEIKLIDAPDALRLQYGRPQVQVGFQQNGHVAQAEFALAGLAENGRFQQLLREGSIKTMHTQEATLEEIFIEVTGRQLA